MSKRHSAKYKIDRRMGENLWGRPKSPVNDRAYGPGQHGQRRKSKVSDFGLQLRAKQKLKGYYANLTEKQFRRTYDEAARRKGNTSELLIGLLESRLDAIVYRSKFVPTPFAARQFVNHGHVTVNGKKVNIPVVPLPPRRRGRGARAFAQHGPGAGSRLSAERDVPDYLEVDSRGLSARFVPRAGTGRGALRGADGANLVVEYYAS
jgi:small subunit ribosomal protein S4